MDPVTSLGIDIPVIGSRSRLTALYQQLKDGIVQHRLAAGLLLPSTRELAKSCRVSRNTVISAYGLLAAEGYVVAKPGGGTYVADAVQRNITKPKVSEPGAADSRLFGSWQSARPFFYSMSSAVTESDFSVGIPDLQNFPFDTWRRLSARALHDLSKTLAVYAEPQGLRGLRAAIRQHASLVRAVSCEDERLVVTSGAQQAFDLIARILVDPGRTVVAVEEPGYPPLWRAFNSAGAKLVGVPVDAEGIDASKIPPSANIICVTPSHQFPLGVAMSAKRRHELIDLARSRNAVIVEDDYDGEFRYGGNPVDALQTLDRHESVFYVGSFSKSLFPALRLGYVATPAWATEALIAAKQQADWHCPILQQQVLARFITEGHLGKHVRKMRRIYGERRSVLLRALEHYFGGEFEVVPSICGLHITCRIGSTEVARTLVVRARREGIKLDSLDRYYMSSPTQDGIIFGLGAIESAQIEPAIRRLSRIFRGS